MGQTNDKTAAKRAPTAARGRKAPAAGELTNPFAQVELSKSQHEELRAWVRVTPEQVWAELSEQISSGYKLTVKWDTYTECPAAWLFAPEDDDFNAGLIMSGRGGTVQSAVAEAVFKVFLLHGKAWPTADSRQRYVPWDELE